MSDHFVIQADKRVVGIAVRVPGGFRFFTSDPAFKSLEAHVFAKAKSIDRLVQDVADARRGSWSETLH